MLWIAAGRTGARGEILRGLIKLAAAGVKLRQGSAESAMKLGRAAFGHVAAAERLGDPTWANAMDFADLGSFADAVARGTLGSVGDPSRTVEVVFERRLAALRPEPDLQ